MATYECCILRLLEMPSEPVPPDAEIAAAMDVKLVWQAQRAGRSLREIWASFRRLDPFQQFAVAAYAHKVAAAAAQHPELALGDPANAVDAYAELEVQTLPARVIASELSAELIEAARKAGVPAGQLWALARVIPDWERWRLVAVLEMLLAYAVRDTEERGRSKRAENAKNAAQRRWDRAQASDRTNEIIVRVNAVLRCNPRLRQPRAVDVARKHAEAERKAMASDDPRLALLDACLALGTDGWLRRFQKRNRRPDSAPA